MAPPGSLSMADEAAGSLAVAGSGDWLASKSAKTTSRWAAKYLGLQVVRVSVAADRGLSTDTSLGLTTLLSVTK